MMKIKEMDKLNVERKIPSAAVISKGWITSQQG